MPPGLSINAATGLISGTPTTNCLNPGDRIVNGGFEAGATGWAGATSTIGAWTGPDAPNTGTMNARLNGRGVPNSETLQQTLTIPGGCRASLTFYLKIHSAEWDFIFADVLTVHVDSTELNNYNNVQVTGGLYYPRTFDVTAFAGLTVTLSFEGVESNTLQTSFVIDDVSINVS